MQPEGDPFKYLGVLFDCKLTMADEISRLTQKARAKVTAIVCSRCFYAVRELVQQCKTNVLCLLEGSNGSICNASPTHISKLDKVQKRFLDEMGSTNQRRFSNTALRLYSFGRILEGLVSCTKWPLDLPTQTF